MFEKIKDNVILQAIAAVSGLFSVGTIVGLAMAYGAANMTCSSYANGKNQEWKVSFPAQCWIVVEGKNYTKKEYAYKFEGIRVTD